MGLKDKDDQAKGGKGEEKKDKDKGKSDKDDQAKDKEKDKKDKEGLAKKDDDKKDDGGKGDAKKDDKGGGKGASGVAGKGSDDDKKTKPLIDDKLDVWGHLPPSRRKEMDAFSRERAVPRYEEVLRQYFRTIAENSRKKEGD
jgi:hypothetical protein